MDRLAGFALVILSIVFSTLGFWMGEEYGLLKGYDNRVAEENQKIIENEGKIWEYAIYAGEDKSTYMGLFTTPYGPLMNSGEFEMKEDLIGPYWARENVRIEIRSDEITKVAREFQRSKKGLE